MLTVKVDPDGLIRSLTKLEEEFQRTSSNAVFEASAALVSKIVKDTLGPPPGPPPTMYERTNRLVHGWGPAASFANIPIPPLTDFAAMIEDEGSASFLEDENRTIFRATNRVPYAVDVEYEGTWQAPLGPHAEPPNFRPGYRIVGTAVSEEEDKFPNYIREAWKLAKNAS